MYLSTYAEHLSFHRNGAESGRRGQKEVRREGGIASRTVRVGKGKRMRPPPPPGRKLMRRIVGRAGEIARGEGKQWDFAIPIFVG